METLYQDAHYLVTFLPRPGATTVIVGFQNRMGPPKAVEPGTYPSPFIPEAVSQSDIPAHFCNFIVNRYSWYLDAEALQAAEAIRRRVQGLRVVTYGSSMGGFAAINLSARLEADFILALSAQSTPLPPFTDAIGDQRYVSDRPLCDPALEVLSQGALHERRGVLIFDPIHTLDSLHAARIASLTSMTLVGVAGSGHPSGPAVNARYGLRRLLGEVVDQTLDIDTLRKTLATEITPGPGPVQGQARDTEALVAELRALIESLDPVQGPHHARLAEVEAACVRAQEMSWTNPGRRRVAFRLLCQGFRRVGRMDLARSLAEAELPPEMAARFLD